MNAEQTFRLLGTAIDDVLIAAHGLEPQLKDPPPYTSSVAEGFARYGESPLFHLWTTLRTIHRLRVAWVGEARP